MHPPRDVRRLAGNAQQMFAVTCLGPDGAARAGPMLDPVRTPRSGSMVPCTKGSACGRRRSRAAIQAPCFSAKSLACFTLPRGGIVSTTSRLTAWIRSV